MIRKYARRWLLAGGLLLTALLVACVQLSPTVVPQVVPAVNRAGGDEVRTEGAVAGSATAVAVTAATGVAVTQSATSSSTRQLVAVRRGSIAEMLTINGRIAAQEEVPLTYSGLGRVEAVIVKPGDVVEQGQLLVQAETAEVERELAAARARLELGTVRVAQAQSQEQARLRQIDQRSAVEGARRESAIQDAEAGVRRAQAELARVKAGPPAADRRAAEAGVLSARSSLERAEAELARASAGPSELELRSADQQVWAARLVLQRAQADYDRLKSGPDAVELRTAEREVVAARSALERARLDLERLARGDSTAIAAAERDVQRANLALRTAQATRIDTSGTGRSARDAERNARVARDASITSARLAVQEAEDRLNLARRGPPPGEIEIGRRNVQMAESALQTALDRLEVVRRGSDELTLATANQAVQAARLAAQTAEARYLALEAGPPADLLRAAQVGVQTARAGLASANDRVAELSNGPTSAELQDAESRVTAAQAALQNAHSAPDAVAEGGDTGAFDLVILQKSLEQDRAQVESLERSVMAAKVVAPFAGIVTAVQVRPGDSLDRGVQILMLAKPGDPIIIADVSPEDAPRVAVGQAATIQGAAGGSPTAAIVGLSEAPGGIGKIAQLQVDWSVPAPSFGTPVQVMFTVREKANTLLVPNRAVRSSGQRRYVEYMDGDTRRTIDVGVGIVGASDTELLTGVREGQVIVVPAGAATPTSTTSP